MDVIDAPMATPTLRGLFPSTPAEVLPLCRRERVVLVLASAAMVLPSWLLGAWELWAQWVTFGLAALSFLALFAPVFNYRKWPPSPGPREMGRRLARFPVFWLGVAILGYGAIAAANPWQALTATQWTATPWTVISVEPTRVWLEPLAHVNWLPRSLLAPFWDMNAARALLVISPAWLVTCSIWAGLESARSLRNLVGLVAANGALLALFGIIQRESGTYEMFWWYNPRPDYSEPAFFSSFIYSGHAAAMLVLAFGAATAMLDRALQNRMGAEPRMEGWWRRASMNAWCWVVALLALGVALNEYVRPDFWALAVAGVLAIWAAIWYRRWRGGDGRWVEETSRFARIIFILLAMTAAGLAGWWGEENGLERSTRAVNPRDPALAVRMAIARTSLAMVWDEPVWGWGPGSYRYAAVDYLKRNPMFTEPGRPQVLRYRANHAHSDWVQYAAEWGGVGTGLFAAIIAWWTWRVWRLRKTLPLESWCVLGGAALVLVGAAVDFPLYNPAVLIVTGGLLAAAVKPGELAAHGRAPS